MKLPRLFWGYIGMCYRQKGYNDITYLASGVQRCYSNSGIPNGKANGPLSGNWAYILTLPMVIGEERLVMRGLGSPQPSDCLVSAVHPRFKVA